MLLAIARNWWVLLLRGICAILFGLLAWTWPGLTLAVLILLYGAYAFVDGVAAIAIGAAARRHADGRVWWEMILVGILGVCAGIVAVLWPGLTAFALLMVIAAWAIVRGVFEIAAAVRLRKLIDNEWALIAGGVLSILFGVVLFLRPGPGALALIWVIGLFAVIYGVFAIALALQLRHHRNRLDPNPFRGGHPPIATA
jgi:uncharacterized membrane protein HdeD (DUF308 family)